ncbi:MAG TPA: membrane-bound PQQ-dependent dehydrogenase, glucose/quinate/shikimate family [Xanthomonadaceae bacterium]|nr:membrane-bound PQQ-dependent dehydrogenase, glucose/quinate/shikimate family [Xanthomonadaceae bacterium]
MNAPPASSARAHPWRALLGLVIVLLGLALAIGGAMLVAAGGSWYYLPAGIALTVSGVLLMRGRMAGAWWYWAVLVATALWSAWESGLDYWRWVPRLGLFVLLGILVALVQPRLADGPSRGRSWALAAVLGVVFLAAFALAFAPYGVTGPSGPLPQARAAAGASSLTPQADADWVAYGRGYDALRYSPLAQIDRGNVRTLERAWTYRTGDLPEHRWGAETTPLKVGDALYLCSARNILIALDARTGRERWRYDPKVPDANIPYTAACRGVSYYALPAAPAQPAATAATAGNASNAAVTTAPPAPGSAQTAGTPAGANADCRARIIEGTLDGRLVAVDAASGRPCAGFGRGGQVDITVGMGEVSPAMVSITSAPTIVRGVVVTGHQVLDGQRRWAPSGVIQGYDAVTGELRWAWDMKHPDWSGRPPQGQAWARGTPNMWTTASGDEALGLVYLPMGNSAVDYWSTLRSPEENRYATSLVALDVTTGKPRWHFQTVHMDVWDYDLGAQASLVDFPTRDGVMPALVLPSKQGDMYVLDRRTGAPLVAVEERPAPAGGVEPAQRAKTQPHSTYHTLRKRDLTERDMWGITPIDQLVCRIQFRRAHYQGFYTPPVAHPAHSVEYPGYNGGTDWGGIAVDPRRGIIIANYNDMPNYVQLVPRALADKLGWAPRDQVRGEPGGAEGAGDPQAQTPYAVDVNAGWRLDFTGLLCKQPPYGGIRAIELATGRTLWDRPFGEARNNGPFGISSGLPIEIGTPNNGGAALTAGGLVFIAAATDNLIRAIDIDTGETLWRDVLPAGGQATPMVYAIAGREYLVIMAGGHHFMETPEGDYVIAYALPENAHAVAGGAPKR